MEKAERVIIEDTSTYDFFLSMVRLNCSKRIDKAYQRPKYRDAGLKPDKELKYWVDETRSELPSDILDLLDRFVNCETFFGLIPIVKMPMEKIKTVQEIIEFLKDLPEKEMLKYYLYTGLGPVIEDKSFESMEKLVDTLTSNDEEMLTFITKSTLYSTEQKANLLEFFNNPKKMKEDYIYFLEWYYENVYSKIEDEVKKSNKEKTKILKENYEKHGDDYLIKLDFTSHEKVFEKKLYLGISYFLGMSSLSAMLEDGGRIYLIGYDILEKPKLKLEDRTNYIEVFNALGNYDRIRILKHLLKEGDTEAAKLAKILNITMYAMENHLHKLSEAGLVKSEMKEPKLILKVDSDKLKKVIADSVDELFKL
ncbi:MAG: helix-turn-helix domain-containing protein [Kosmotogaceae bacterium]